MQTGFHLLEQGPPQLDQYWNGQDYEHDVGDNIQHSCVVVSEFLPVEVMVIYRV